MKQLYRREWENFKRDYMRSFLWVLFLSLGFTILTYFSLVNYPEMAQKYMGQLRDQIDFQAESLGEDLDQVRNNSDLFILIIKNNIVVSLIMFALSFIPVVILPPYLVLSTFSSVGVALAYIKSKGGDPIIALLTSILPHGVLEISAMLFTSSIGIYMSLAIAKKIFSKKRQEIHLKGIFVQALRSFLLVSIPLIVLAAVIEGFITPLFI
jgi:stage II sporulation protein M